MYYNLCEKKYPKVYNPRGDIPSYYYGIPTDVIESGEFLANSGFDAKIRPVNMGYGIRPYDPTAMAIPTGTAGCIVTSTSNVTVGSKFFILGNNHVMAGLNRLPIGNPILQPQNSPVITDSIATLAAFVQLKFITPRAAPENYVDAAIAQIDDVNIVTPKIAFLEIPKGINANPKQGSIIKKSGATTGYTTGTIVSESGTCLITYLGGKQAYFVDQILATRKSQGGDSGAAVLNEDDEIIGLLMGASQQCTLINKIITVENALGIRVYTQR